MNQKKGENIAIIYLEKANIWNQNEDMKQFYIKEIIIMHKKRKTKLDQK